MSMRHSCLLFCRKQSLWAPFPTKPQPCIWSACHTYAGYLSVYQTSRQWSWNTDRIIQSRAAETMTQLLSRSRRSVMEQLIVETVQDSTQTLKRLWRGSSLRLVAVRRLDATISAYLPE